MSIAEQWMHPIDRDRYADLPERARRQWLHYVEQEAVKRPPLNLKQWMILHGYAVSYRLDDNTVASVQQEPTPVAYMTFAKDRAITARELEAIPADKERRANVKRMYGIDLFSSIDEVILSRRRTRQIHEATAVVHLEKMVHDGWVFEYEYATRYVVARHPSRGGLQSVCEVYPGWGVAIASALNRITATMHERDAFNDALTPNGATKYAYLGEFKMPVVSRGYDDDGEEYERTDRHVVSWDVIKEIMTSIKKRAEQDAIRRIGAAPEKQPPPVYTWWQRFCLKIARLPT